MHVEPTVCTPDLYPVAVPEPHLLPVSEHVSYGWVIFQQEGVVGLPAVLRVRPELQVEQIDFFFFHICLSVRLHNHSSGRFSSPAGT